MGTQAAAGGVRLRFANGVICLSVAVNGGLPRWTRLDTGCTDALDWCEGAGPRPVAADRTVALASAAAGSLRADVAFGQARLHDVPVELHPREIFPGEAGLLGNAALARFRSVTIAALAGRILLDAAR